MDDIIALNKFFISAEHHPDLYNFVEVKLELNYKTEISTHLPTQKIHLGIIPDGNRRWCKQHGMTFFDFTKMVQHMILSMFYNIVSRKVPPIFNMVDEVSIYVLSKDNLKRDDDTLHLIEEVMDLFCAMLKVDEFASQVVFDVHGEILLLPDSLQSKIQTCIQLSKGSFPIHLAIGYDPLLDSELCLKHPRRQIDMVVRSGGQLRSSGFYPLQTLYSEWVYYDTLWPDMTLSIMSDALMKFLARQRNFGK